MGSINTQQAEAIYRYKMDLIDKNLRDTGRAIEVSVLKRESRWLSRKYHVIPKTIRDIWNRRTWVRTTSILWKTEDAKMSEMSEMFTETRRRMLEL